MEIVASREWFQKSRISLGMDLHLDQSIAEDREGDFPVTGKIPPRMKAEQVVKAIQGRNAAVKCLFQVMNQYVSHKNGTSLKSVYIQ